MVVSVRFSISISGYVDLWTSVLLSPVHHTTARYRQREKEEMTENPKVSTLIAFCLACAQGSLDQVQFFPPEESLRECRCLTTTTTITAPAPKKSGSFGQRWSSNI
uniref:HDC09525 n=1 Tax=Drosophila melanogaster TaxID=7227 RepID=Q6ILE2_DROME|nr:TPA_inf: HDC09525 [Drosophila melanogaster]